MFHLHPTDIACVHFLVNFLHSSTQGPGPSPFPLSSCGEGFFGCLRRREFPHRWGTRPSFRALAPDVQSASSTRQREKTE
ncbi:uncharacterized [Tachysurus ichikawai]